ncbi:MAG TPA: NAD(+) kinase [Povalibacter sp.]|uniref:NAD(+) kinase n=1 Tax=Povalibacter sp. TaxID=1962978 RepID=UPI002CBC9E4D|nr:NAD(+) kinase [Povalibacter sp.]HMN47212.1 NAD(+) kinase [Povalibacter sp.]
MSPTAESFKSIALVGNHHDSRVGESMLILATYLHGRGCRILLASDAELDVGSLPIERHPEKNLGSNVDLIVAVGGDGTMLSAARLAAPFGVPVLGVNRGRLGFLADITPSDIRERLDDVLGGRYVKDQRAMLQATLIRANLETCQGQALNDVVVQKWQTGRMLDFETWIDGRYVNSHGGDGLVIATATGSTAYALSCGGPILYPELDATVLAPICPHTLSDRPIVIRSSATIEVRLVDRPEANAHITCDGVSLGELEVGDRLLVTRAATSVTLLHPPDHDYYRILRSKLRWGRGDRMLPGSSTD